MQETSYAVDQEPLSINGKFMPPEPKANLKIDRVKLQRARDRSERLAKMKQQSGEVSASCKRRRGGQDCKFNHHLALDDNPAFYTQQTGPSPDKSSLEVDYFTKQIDDRPRPFSDLSQTIQISSEH